MDTGKLGMETIVDDPIGPELRWITVKLPEDESSFVLANFSAFDGEGSGWVIVQRLTNE